MAGKTSKKTYEYTARAKTARDDTQRSDIVMTFDPERAVDVLTAAVKAYRARTHIFAYDNLFPEQKMPPFIEQKSKEHVMWHLLGVFFDHTIVSAYMYRDLYFLVQNNPGLLSVDSLLEHDEDSLEELLRTRMAHPDSRREGRFLLDAIADYRRNFGSDISAILRGKGSSDLAVVRDRLMGLKNIREKKANLFLLYMMKYGIKRFRNPEALDLAVDFHKIRVSYATGIIDFNVSSVTGQVARRLVRIAYNDFIRNNPDRGFSMIDIDDVLWVIPAKVCSKNAGAREQNHLCQTHCPLPGYCVKPVVRNDYRGYFDFTASIKPPGRRGLGMDVSPLTREMVLARRDPRYENIPFVEQDYSKIPKENGRRQMLMFPEEE